MALRDPERAIGLMSKGTLDKVAAILAQPHRPAHVAIPVQLAPADDDLVRGVRRELRAVGFLQPGERARVLDRSALHAQADAEEGDLVLAGVRDGPDLALDPPLAEAAGAEEAVLRSQDLRRIVLLPGLR